VFGAGWSARVSCCMYAPLLLPCMYVVALLPPQKSEYSVHRLWLPPSRRAHRSAIMEFLRCGAHSCTEWEKLALSMVSYPSFFIQFPFVGNCQLSPRNCLFRSPSVQIPIALAWCWGDHLGAQHSLNRVFGLSVRIENTKEQCCSASFF
jgi:hypothetical protein